MSLDVYLYKSIFSDGGLCKEELQINDDTLLFDANITHNLNIMAKDAGIYEALWRPYMLHKDYINFSDYKQELEFEESVSIFAKDIIHILEKGYKDMLKRPKYYKKFNSSNEWGNYDDFLPWIKNYLDACKQNPESLIKIWR